MKNNILQISILVLLILSSCKSKDCYNQSEILSKYKPESKIYKIELAKQIKLLHPDQVTYLVDGYKKIDNKEFINITIQADGLCAKTALLVNNWDSSIINIKQTQAKGYYGAELYHLKYELIEDSTGIQWVFKSVDSILD